MRKLQFSIHIASILREMAADTEKTNGKDKVLVIPRFYSRFWMRFSVEDGEDAQVLWDFFRQDKVIKSSILKAPFEIRIEGQTPRPSTPGDSTRLIFKANIIDEYLTENGWFLSAIPRALTTDDVFILTAKAMKNEVAINGAIIPPPTTKETRSHSA